MTATAPGAAAAIAAALTARVAASNNFLETRSPVLALLSILVPATLAALVTLLLTDRELRRSCAAMLGTKPFLGRSSA